MNNYKYLVSFFFVFSLLCCSLVVRENFFLFFGFISVSFISYFLISKSNFKNSHLWKLTLFSYLIAFFILPNLSNDYFRFLWDGKLILLGINPFDYTPNELNQTRFVQKNDFLLSLFQYIDPISKENFSCYPVLNQIYFLLASCSNSLYLNTLLLKSLILISTFIGFRFLFLLLKEYEISEKNAFYFILNPLVIIETSQNLHFEAVMLAFIIIAFYFLKKERFFHAGIFFAFAIQIKLIPLMILPFLLRNIGWKNAIITWTVSLVITVLFSIILIDETNIMNFVSSLKLYFKLFEFNSFILHWYIEYGRWKFGYNRIQTFGPYLSRISAEIIIVLAWLGNNFSIKNLFTRLLFAFTAYYLLSSTVHPWYLILPLFFTIFTSFKYMFIWSFLIFLSYYSYSNPSNFNLRSLQAIEYLILFGVIIVEFWRLVIVKYFYTKSDSYIFR